MGDTENKSRNLLVGKIGGAYGIKGWVKVRSFTQPIDALLEYKPWLFGDEHQATAAGLIKARLHGKGLVARFDGVDDRNQTVALLGKMIYVARENLPAPEPGEYYWEDLQGLEVWTLAGRQLGQVSGMLETGAHDVLQVGSGKEQILIPFVMDVYVHKVQLDEGKIFVDWDWE